MSPHPYSTIENTFFSGGLEQIHIYRDLSVSSSVTDHTVFRCSFTHPSDQKVTCKNDEYIKR